MDKFFRKDRVFAIAGASSNPAKFSYKVLKWYKDHDVPVVPINFRKETILGIPSVANVTDVPVAAHQDLALSVVTPPAITKELLEAIDGAQGKVDAMWLQPGTYDEQVLKLAKEKVPSVICDCVLVNGARFLPSRL